MHPMKNLNSTFGQRIKFLREGLDQSLGETSKALGVSKTHLWELENGTSKNPSLNIIISCCHHFHVPVAALIENKETAKYRKIKP